MKTIITNGLLIASLWGGVGVSRQALGDIDIVPEATTQKQFRALERAFYQRTMIEAYQSVGDHDPLWDENAISFLEESALALCDALQATSEEQRLRLGEAAIQAGCNDPLIMHEYSRLRLARAKRTKDQSDLQRATSLVYGSIMAMQTSGYSVAQKFAANTWLWKQYTRAQRKSKNPELRPLLDQIYVDASQMIMGDVYRDTEHRLLIKHLNVLTNHNLFPITDTQRLYETLQNADPWVRNMIGGRYHIEAAWAARGGDWASKVTDEGWKGFKEHLRQARQRLTEAARLNPERPEAAWEMIEVAMGASADSVREMRQWFDLAVKVQMDYEPAYRQLLWGLQPRWHGSHDAMYAFGLECAQVPRYDTLQGDRIFMKLRPG